MQYRSEIDGIRALAVLSVVVYHAEFLTGFGTVLSGGFIGVDVFFVISGYLITGIILDQISRNQFNLIAFYTGRVRRIVPALLVMVIVSTIFSAWYMLPEQFVNYAKSAFSALGFFSNFLFAFEDSYNADASALKPLLHTWSLGVEGQYYLLYPLLLLLIIRASLVKYITGIILLGFVGSFLIAQFMSTVSQDLNFFLIPSRAWELFAGAAIAILQLQLGGRQSNSVLSSTMPTLGLAMILFAFVFFDDKMLLPSLLSIVPVVGTGLLIWFSAKDDLVTDILSTGPIVFLGKISYSLYLWHFPVFAFMQIGNFGFESVKMKLVGIGIALCLSLISYYLIERPFRNRNLIGGRPFLSSLSVGLLATVFALTLTIQNEGFPQRMGELQKLFTQTRVGVVSDDNGICNNRIFKESCVFLNQSQNIILIGDSHAAAISWALANAASRNNWKFTTISSNACNQLPGLIREPSSAPTSSLRELSRKCVESTNRLEKTLRSSIDATIVYFARLPIYLEGANFDNGEGGYEQDCKAMCDIPIDRNLFPKVGSRDMVISLGLNHWQKMGHNLIVVYPYPEMGWNVPQKIRRELSGFPLLKWATKYKDIVVSTSYQLFKQRTASSYSALDRLPDNGQTFRVKPEEWICSENTGRCSANDADGIYYFDDDHPSIVGSIKIVDRIEEIIRDQIIQEP